MRIQPVFALIMCALLLTACATPQVITKITTFHQLTIAPGATISVIPVDVGQQRSLEYAAYRPKLEQRLAGAGFTVRDGGDTEYTATLKYTINTGEAVTSVEGGTGYGKVGVDQSGNAVYGAVPTVSSTTYTIYTRTISLLIDRQNAPGGAGAVRVYEGRAVSKGTCGSLLPVIEEILEAIFQEFPGENGSTRNAAVPWGQPSC